MSWLSRRIEYIKQWRAEHRKIHIYLCDWFGLCYIVQIGKYEKWRVLTGPMQSIYDKKFTGHFCPFNNSCSIVKDNVTSLELLLSTGATRQDLELLREVGWKLH